MTPENTIVFYHTAPISESPDKGSTVRVRMLSQALTAHCGNVRIIAGTRSQRWKLIKQLKSDVARGLEVSYVYAENTNAPVSLEGKHLNLLGLKQHVDFLHWLRSQQICIGYFYRDVHWRFPFFKNFLPGPMYRLLRPFYYLDWYVIDKYSELLFLPSSQMNNWLPKPRKVGAFAPLPPGFDPDQCTPQTATNRKGPVNLLYVGGLEDPVYSLRGTLKAIKNRRDIRLTLCCRAQEWKKYSEFYNHILGDNCQVVHSRGEGLCALYKRADATLLTVDETPYWKFVYPVKLAESIGYGTPVICCSYQNAVAESVKAENLGWVIGSPAEIPKLVGSADFFDKAIAIRKSTRLARLHHSWAARAAAIEMHLCDHIQNKASYS